MSKELLKHIRRTQLPWRTDDGLTECGLPAERHPSESRDEAITRFKQQGQQRFALLTCMTCTNQANLRYKVEADKGIIPVLLRELERVQWKQGDDRERMVNELEAMILLIEAHRDEFDAAVEAKGNAVDLAAVRRSRYAKTRYGS